MLNLAHIAANAEFDTNSWFESSWGEGPFSFSETLGMVLASDDPTSAARNFHTTNTSTGNRVVLRDFFKQLQRREQFCGEMSNQAAEMLENVLSHFNVGSATA